MTTTTWDQPAWDAIQAAAPGLPRIVAALQATIEACDAAIGLHPVGTLDPFAGWAATGGTLAGLLLATGQHTAPPPTPLAAPPDQTSAAVVVDRLFREAADQILAHAEVLRAQLPTLAGPWNPAARGQLDALLAAIRMLADAYTQTFGRPW